MTNKEIRELLENQLKMLSGVIERNADEYSGMELANAVNAEMHVCEEILKFQKFQ